MYTLHTVLVHSGDNYGGHYVAYLNPGGKKKVGLLTFVSVNSISDCICAYDLSKWCDEFAYTLNSCSPVAQV